MFHWTKVLLTYADNLIRKGECTMSITKKQKISVSILATAALLMVFQNCTNTKFTLDSSQMSKLDDVGGGDGGVITINNPDDPEPDVPNTPDNQNNNHDGNHITGVEDRAFVLICNKRNVTITSIDKDATVVLVGGNFSSITGTEAGSLVLLVNSTLNKYRPSHRGVVRSAEGAEIQQWIDKCNELAIDVVPVSTPNFSVNQLLAGQESSVPKMAHKYQFNTIQSHVVLENLLANHISATKIATKATLKIRTHNFQITTIAADAKAEFH